jgi:hypothetical protein
VEVKSYIIPDQVIESAGKWRKFSSVWELGTFVNFLIGMVKCFLLLNPSETQTNKKVKKGNKGILITTVVQWNSMKMIDKAKWKQSYN